MVTGDVIMIGNKRLCGHFGTFKKNVSQCPIAGAYEWCRVGAEWGSGAG